MKIKKISVFPVKNKILELLVGVLGNLALAAINFQLMILLNKASEFLAELVPSETAWTVVVMVIPITVFGIYASSLLSNYNQNKNLIIWGKTYIEIKKQKDNGNTLPRIFLVNAVFMTFLFVIYFVQQNHPMLVGAALVLSVDLLVLTFFEMYEGTKSEIDLYKQQFAYHRKNIKSIFLTEVELSKIEVSISAKDYETAENVFLSKCGFFNQSLPQLEYEMQELPRSVKKEIWVRYINFFSLDLKRIENAIFYKRQWSDLKRISTMERANGDNFCANEIVLCFSEFWIKRANQYLRTMRKRIQKLAPQAKRNFNGLFDFTKEILRNTISFDEFIIIQEDVLKILVNVDSIPSNDLRKKSIENNIDSLNRSMKELKGQFEKLFSLLVESTKKHNGSNKNESEGVA